MELEFQGRFLKMPEPLSEEQRMVNRALNNGEDSPQEVEYEYSPIVFDIFDTRMYNQTDPEHTTVFLKDGEVLVLKVAYKMYKYVMEFFSGRMVRAIEEFGFQEMLIEKTKQINEIVEKLKAKDIESAQG